MAKYIKNNTGSAKTWCGQTIQASAYHLVPATEEIQWANDSTLLTAIAAAEAVVATADGSGNITDVNLAINYLKDISSAPVDVDGAPLTRTKITKTGWHYQVHGLEFETSKLNSIHNKDSAGNNLGFSTVKFYNAAGTELTAGTQGELDTDCVKTIISWEPTHDLELIGGSLFQSAAPNTDIRLWVTAVPDVPVAYGGSVPFVQGGINLRFVSNGATVDVDGRTSKMLSYSATNHTSKFHIILKHDAGVNHKLMMLFYLFRNNA